MGLLPVIRAIPMSLNPFHVLAEDEPPMSPQKPTLWIYLAVAIALVLLGGAFAGLTIALMGQVRPHKYCKLGAGNTLTSSRTRSIYRS